MKTYKNSIYSSILKGGLLSLLWVMSPEAGAQQQKDKQEKKPILERKAPKERAAENKKGKKADKPLFRDPVYDGAADPVIIRNKEEDNWYMFYTNRRANVEGLEGVEWVHNTPVSIAVSTDGGASWRYKGEANINYGEDDYSYWAPDVIEHNGTYHMYLTVVPGTFKDWSGTRDIVHLTSSNLVDWEFQSVPELASDRVIDAGIMQLPNGNWGMWYNNERDRKSIYYAESPDLYNWEDKGKATGDQSGEGPKVFRWKDKYWMVVDMWRGLGVYSSDDAVNWKRQENNILEIPGEGKDDQVKGGHADVVVSGDRAYLFYFTHPGRRGPDKDKDTYEQRRSSIQVVELELKDGKIEANRDKAVFIALKPEK